MSRLSRLLGIAALAACALAAPARALESGDAAPAFSAPGVTGGVISLASSRGRVVYLDFWASWCGPCAQALPALERLRREFPADAFSVVAVNVDQNPALAKSFLRRRPVGYPSALDPEGAIPGRYGVASMPTSFLIDRDGIVRHVHRGFRAEDEALLRERIQELVAAGR
jgi:peroxiredoxin